MIDLDIKNVCAIILYDYFSSDNFQTMSIKSYLKIEFSNYRALYSAISDFDFDYLYSNLCYYLTHDLLNFLDTDIENNS